MRVIGTAGHVDHGKSTLVAALTGIHPDRLKEEQVREMTIELGFAWMTLPTGEEVGIVDVPGHRDFIENMLSGIGGIDAVLLVIAADEGIMPQTREHLAILDLLQVPAGLIVLTKTDLASDSSWLDLLETDIRGTLAGTVLQDSPMIRVSAKNNMGLDTLKSELGTLLSERPSRPDLNRPRLPIDRVFTMSGFGTVVTGTLSDGHLSAGDEIQVLPSGHKGRVRGLQRHRQKEQIALPGSRTAVNISGIDAGSIRRGEVLVHPGQYQPTRRVDATFRLLRDIQHPLKHGDEVKFFVGASETMASLRLLGVDELHAGEDGWVQLELRDPLITIRGDRYILRRPSPGETLGGGAVVDAQPRGRHKRFDEKVLKSLSSLSGGTPAEVLFEAALALNAAVIREVVARSRLETSAAEPALRELVHNSQLVVLEDGPVETTSDLLCMARPNWNHLRELAEGSMDSYHEQFPLRIGIPREELKSRLQLAPRVFHAVMRKLATENILVDANKLVHRPGREIKYAPAEQMKIQNLMRRFEQNPYATPAIKECRAEVGEEIFNALVESGELVQVSQDVVFRQKEYQELIERVKQAIEQNGQVTLAEVRDMAGTSRKYVQAFLEHLDATGLTSRDGDSRKLRR
jgi:selenocysteine-specific elongation factor